MITYKILYNSLIIAFLKWNFHRRLWAFIEYFTLQDVCAGMHDRRIFNECEKRNGMDRFDNKLMNGAYEW